MTNLAISIGDLTDAQLTAIEPFNTAATKAAADRQAAQNALESIADAAADATFTELQKAAQVARGKMFDALKQNAQLATQRETVLSELVVELDGAVSKATTEHAKIEKKIGERLTAAGLGVVEDGHNPTARQVQYEQRVRQSEDVQNAARNLQDATAVRGVVASQIKATKELIQETQTALRDFIASAV